MVFFSEELPALHSQAKKVEMRSSDLTTLILRANSQEGLRKSNTVQGLAKKQLQSKQIPPTYI